MKHGEVVPVLYTDECPDSKRAEEVLGKARIRHQTIVISNPKAEGVSVPQLLSARGVFDSLDAISWYAKVYGMARR